MLLCLLALLLQQPPAKPATRPAEDAAATAMAEAEREAIDVLAEWLHESSRAPPDLQRCRALCLTNDPVSAAMAELPARRRAAERRVTAARRAAGIEGEPKAQPSIEVIRQKLRDRPRQVSEYEIIFPMVRPPIEGHRLDRDVAPAMRVVRTKNGWLVDPTAMIPTSSLGDDRPDKAMGALGLLAIIHAMDDFAERIETGEVEPEGLLDPGIALFEHLPAAVEENPELAELAGERLPRQFRPEPQQVENDEPAGS